MKISRQRGATLLALLLFYMTACGGAGAAEAQFFEGLSDVPLMEGLTESPGEAYLFDKPEGRIAGAAAYGEAVIVGLKAAEDYYRQTLPQFGWKQAKNDGSALLFRREGEELRVEVITDRGARLIVAITINPARD